MKRKNETNLPHKELQEPKNNRKKGNDLAK